ncbi:MAG: hypothetical protein GY793_08485 [Proteobacteria bacterium]|nr:hypothetical protein [Pseudomonadota bacterium]
MEKNMTKLLTDIAKQTAVSQGAKATFNAEDNKLKALHAQLTNITRNQFLDKFSSEGKESGTVTIARDNFKLKAKLDCVFKINEENVLKLPEDLISRVFSSKLSFSKKAYNELSVEEQDLILDSKAAEKLFKELDIKVEVAE